MMRRNLRTASFLMVACAMGWGASPSRADFIRYGNYGTFTTPGPFSANGVTATSVGGPLSFIANPGPQRVGLLGVEGGLTLPNGLPLIDNDESILFTFDAGPVSSVTLFATPLFRGDQSATFARLEAFGVGGVSLGQIRVPDLTVDLAVRFGSPLTGFRVFSDRNSGIAVAGINFTPSPAAVPEPSSLALCGAALAGLGAWARRRAATA